MDAYGGGGFSRSLHWHTPCIIQDADCRSTVALSAQPLSVAGTLRLYCAVEKDLCVYMAQADIQADEERAQEADAETIALNQSLREKKAEKVALSDNSRKRRYLAACSVLGCTGACSHACVHKHGRACLYLAYIHMQQLTGWIHILNVSHMCTCTHGNWCVGNQGHERLPAGQSGGRRGALARGPWGETRVAT